MFLTQYEKPPYKEIDGEFFLTKEDINSLYHVKYNNYFLNEFSEHKFAILYNVDYNGKERPTKLSFITGNFEVVNIAIEYLNYSNRLFVKKIN